MWRSALLAIALAVPAASRGQGAGVEFVSAIDDVLLLRAFANLAADSMQGRRMASPGSLKAREYIVAQLKRMEIEPLVPDYVATFPGRIPEEMPGGVARFQTTVGSTPQTAIVTSMRGVTGSNIFGVVRGTEHPERYIVVSAHYDHVGIQGGQLHPGANDNASGAAALFAIADLLTAAKPKNSIVIAFFDGEEYGMLGSNAFFKNPPLNLKQVVANVNLDMLARNDEAGLYVVGSKFYPAFGPIITGAGAIGAITVRAGHEGRDQQEDYYKRSDQLSFHEHGIPAVMLTTGNFEDLHRPTDTAFRANVSAYVRAVSAAAEFVRRLDESYDLLFTKKR
jgi:Zn-dependent M28 family amino/carboxypeptidase